MEPREISFVPGLYKIFDEILVNAADNKQRDPSMNTIKVDIDREASSISVYNNGSGIPVKIHKEYQMYVPELIFGHLLTSSNYDDSIEKVTGGRNGYGAKLTNIFSKSFTIETADAKTQKIFKQTFTNNMSNRTKPKITEMKKKTEYTRVTFTPDLEKFGMTELDDDICDLLVKRVYDLAGITHKSVKVYLNGTKLPISDFKNYVNLFLPDTGEAPVIYESPNDRWEVVVSVSDGQFKQASFVNSISTWKGGAHVKYVTDMVVKRILEQIAKKHKSKKLKPFQVKNHLSVFVNCLVVNPTFDSQTKENMTSRPSKFGSKCELSDDFYKKVMKCGIIENIISWAKFKESRDLKKNDGKKKARITDIPKLEDANKAGTRDGEKCTLILTEGDSAKALAVSGLSVIGRDYYGVFPLKGKLLNVRDAKHATIMKNEEITNLKKIMGLQQGKKYEDRSALRYGSIMIMTDQDVDGSHIKGLLINLLHVYWPSLLQMDGFLTQFITPIVKVRKGRTAESFYTLSEYNNWKEHVKDISKYTIKYYKGLGTSTSAEAKEYFSDLEKHKVDFYWGENNGEDIAMAFSKSKADERKQWLAAYEPGNGIDYSERVNYHQFVHDELIEFSIADNMRSIPSLMDGLKPGQRKILFCAFKRNLKKEIKVGQLSGIVSQMSAYHHGEASLCSTVVNLAQNYVGSNNINLLQPIGQFGTRHENGKDCASPRYIYTALSQVTRAIFHPNDDELLRYLDDDGKSIEPFWYAPIIPMVLVNGASGIGTGWSTDIPNYNPREIVRNLKLLISGRGIEELPGMQPWYKGFKGEIEEVVKGTRVSYNVYGCVDQIDESTVALLELPLKKSTQSFKEFLEKLLEKGVITNFESYHTDVTVDFRVTFSDANKGFKTEEELRDLFKLHSSLSATNLVLFNSKGSLTKYANVNSILFEFFQIRMDLYVKRKAYLVNSLSEKVSKLQNKARFITEVVNNRLVINKKKKNEILLKLHELDFQLYPSKPNSEDPVESESEDEDVDELKTISDGYDYLLSMKLWSLTEEKIEQLQAQVRDLEMELDDLLAKSPEELWIADLDGFLEILTQVEDAEELAYEEMLAALEKKKGKRAGRRPAKKAVKAAKSIKAVKKEPVVKKEKKSASVKTEPLTAKDEVDALISTFRKANISDKKPKVSQKKKSALEFTASEDESLDQNTSNTLKGNLLQRVKNKTAAKASKRGVKSGKLAKNSASRTKTPDLPKKMKNAMTPVADESPLLKKRRGQVIVSSDSESGSDEAFEIDNNGVVVRTPIAKRIRKRKAIQYFESDEESAEEEEEESDESVVELTDDSESDYEDF